MRLPHGFGETATLLLRGRCLAGLPFTILAVSLTASCDRPQPDSARADSTSPQPQAPEPALATPAHPPSPQETVRLAHEHRVSGRLGLVGPLVIPEQRPHVMELIQSVDRLLAANHTLQAAAGEKFGSASAALFDLAQVANLIGVFSHDVEVLDERITGDSAVVTIQVAKRVPLQQVRLVRRDGRWLIQTDPPIEGVAAEVRNLADVLVDAVDILAEKSLTLEELRGEVESRQKAVGRRLALLAERPAPLADR